MTVVETRAVPVFEPCFGDEELANVTECLKEGWISGWGGRFTKEFEGGFARYCGAKYGVATTNCGSAIMLALQSLGIGRGDEVITSAFTMIATVAGIVYSGATPVVVDSEPQTWNLNPMEVEQKIGKRTMAIMPVHIYGHPVEMAPLWDMAKRHGLYIIEEAAEAHGAEYRGRKVGSLGDAACFSFYINKMITTGEGGMVVTNDKGVANRARDIKNYCHPLDHGFVHENLGFNYRMSNLQAAIGVAQLKRIDSFIEQKRRIAHLYGAGLRGVGGLTLPVEMPYAKHVYWVYGVVVEPEFGMSRDEAVRKLKDKGIETRNFFVPMNRQPALLKMGLFRGERCPVAEKLGERGFYLPNGVNLTDDDISYICGCIRGLKR